MRAQAVNARPTNVIKKQYRLKSHLNSKSHIGQKSIEKHISSRLATDLFEKGPLLSIQSIVKSSISPSLPMKPSTSVTAPAAKMDDKKVDTAPVKK